ncbi:MAG: radical SAM protein [Candidatus Bathyarchaeia archaeon]|jgi:molybdenum cofactor biosynthesis enzyme MoaA
MKLEEIGFYTLTDARAAQTSNTSPMWRCEMILTGRCNFKCPYCRGVGVISRDCSEDMELSRALTVLDTWLDAGLKNIRFSGGEPTLYAWLPNLVDYCKQSSVEHIAISTNGSQDLGMYKRLIDVGVNDFSISLDACCATFGDKMSGISGKWDTVVENIRQLSKLTYVTVGVVLTPDNVESTKEIIEFAHSLGVADIRIISAAQYNEVLAGLQDISQDILDAHPILKYRINNFSNGRNVRGIRETDCHKCHLVKDDSVVAGKWHFPCVIHMREGGQPIGAVGHSMREERMEWFRTTNTFEHSICRQNCLDVCIDYNNKVEELSINKY